MAQILPIKMSKFDNQPWGFRLQGGIDFAAPLTIQKVNVGSLAEKAGLQAGDSILKINDVDVFNMRHKEAQETVIKAGNNFEILISRGDQLKPKFSDPLPLPAQANIPPRDASLTKEHLAASSQGARGIGSNPTPASFIAQTTDGSVQLVNNQFNSPMALYSEESIAETLSSQAEVLAQGVLGVNFKKNEKTYNPANSEVFKMVQEIDRQPKEPEPGIDIDPAEASPIQKGLSSRSIQSRTFRRLQNAVDCTPLHVAESEPTPASLGLRPVARRTAEPPTSSTIQMFPNLPSAIKATPTLLPTASANPPPAGGIRVLPTPVGSQPGTLTGLRATNVHSKVEEEFTQVTTVQESNYYTSQTNVGYKVAPTYGAPPIQAIQGPALKSVFEPKKPEPPTAFAPRTGGHRVMWPPARSEEDEPSQSVVSPVQVPVAPVAPRPATLFVKENEPHLPRAPSPLAAISSPQPLASSLFPEPMPVQAPEVAPVTEPTPVKALTPEPVPVHEPTPVLAPEPTPVKAPTPEPTPAPIQLQEPTPVPVLAPAPVLVLEPTPTPPQPTSNVLGYVESCAAATKSMEIEKTLVGSGLATTAATKPTNPTGLAGLGAAMAKLPSSAPAPAPPSTGSGTGSSTSAPRRGKGILSQVGPGARIPVCSSCNSQIRGRFVTALGLTWCPNHFVCAMQQCRRPLQDVGFVEEKNELYCETCFENYLAPSCSRCQKRIKGDCLNAIGKQFHPECFACTYCGRLFGNSHFYLEDGLPYCEADWNELFTTKCFACGFPIEAGDRWVEAMNNNYHSQCFTCAVCKKNLEGQSFLGKGGRPMCKSHVR